MKDTIDISHYREQMIRIIAMISFSILSIGLLTSSTMTSYQNSEIMEEKGLWLEASDITASADQNFEKPFTRLQD